MVEKQMAKFQFPAQPALMLAVFLVTGAPALASSDKDSDRDEIRAVVAQLLEFNQSAELLSPKAQALVTGEAAEIMVQPSMGNLPGKPDKVIFLDPDNAVVRVSSEIPPEYALSVYFYLQREQNWKIYSFRALSLVGIIAMLREQCREIARMPQFERSEALASMAGDGLDDFQYQCANTELVLRSDLQIIDWFADNRSELQRIAKLIRKYPSAYFTVDERGPNGTNATEAESEEILRSLHGLALQFARLEPNRSLTFMIGGLVDNSIYILQTRGGSPPQIDPSEFIWVEELAPGWYLVKTT